MSFLKSEITPATEKILQLLVERNPKFVNLLIKHASNSDDVLNKKSLIFGMILHDSKHKHDEKFLQKVFEFYKTNITKYLLAEDDQESSWVEGHVNAVSSLIQKYFGKWNSIKETFFNY